MESNYPWMTDHEQFWLWVISQHNMEVFSIPALKTLLKPYLEADLIKPSTARKILFFYQGMHQ